MSGTSIPLSAQSTVVALLLMAVPASAVPGSQVISDPSGDTGILAAPTNEGLLDLTGVWLDSGSSDLTVTFQLEDLRADQGPMGYELTMKLGSTEVIVRCDVGDHGEPAFSTALNTVTQTYGGRDTLACHAGTRVTTTYDFGVFVYYGSSTNDVQVPHTLDATDDTLSVQVPYSAFGGSSGDVLDSFSAKTCDRSTVASCGESDYATGTGTYTLN